MILLKKTPNGIKNDVSLSIKHISSIENIFLMLKNRIMHRNKKKKISHC